MRKQFILNGFDISDDEYAYVDADCVRLWDDEIVLVEFSLDEKTGYWLYTGSDIGHTMSDEITNPVWESWQDAMNAYGVDVSA